MLYLDNAATGGNKPQSVLESAYAAMKFAANPGRSGHALSSACAERVFACRSLLAGFFGAPSPERVVFTKNCTEALNTAIFSLPKGVILTTVAEHNSVLRPLRALENLGYEILYIPLVSDCPSSSANISLNPSSNRSPSDPSPDRSPNPAYNQSPNSAHNPPPNFAPNSPPSLARGENKRGGSFALDKNASMSAPNGIKNPDSAGTAPSPPSPRSIDLAAAARLIARAEEERKRITGAVVTLASNVTGMSVDIAALKAMLPQECILILDGAQACGHVKVNLKELKADALAVAGHKGMLGIQGSGVLVFSERFDPKPLLYGGTGTESYSAEMPAFYPERLEGGTLNYPAIVSLAEGALYIKTNGRRMRRKVEEYTREAISGLERTEGVRVYSTPNPYGIVAFGVEGVTSERAAGILSEEYSICVRGGLHCAPLMHKALKSGGLVRASFSAFTPAGAPAALVSAVRGIARR